MNHHNVFQSTSRDPATAVHTLLIIPFAILSLLAMSMTAVPAKAAVGSLVHDGLVRSYVLRGAEHLGPDHSPHPLVIVLHGGGGNSLNAERMTGFTEKAAIEDFVVVYPSGTSNSANNKRYTWNAQHCCAHAMRAQVDDVGFIRALIEKLSSEYPIDPARIYVTGMSNGGMMSHRVGIALSDKVAAVAPVVSGLHGDEALPDYPVSALMINGKLDASVPYQGGNGEGAHPYAADGTPLLPARAQGLFWANANDCKRFPVREKTSVYLRHTYRCSEGLGVEYYLIEEGGHAWPGGRLGTVTADAPVTNFDATDVIWQFFESHPKVLSDSF